MPSAIITGAAKRIGREIALFLAQQGYDIALHYNNSAEQASQLAQEIKALGRDVVTIKQELNNLHEVKSIASKAADAFGNIDIVVQNASIFKKDNLHDVSEELFQEHLNLNLLAPIFLTKSVVKHNDQQHPLNVIFMLDCFYGWSISEKFLSYSISKLAAREAVKLLSKELAPYARVNAVSPFATLPGYGEDELFKKVVKTVPLKRLSEVSEILDSIDLLLNNKSMTGQVIDLSCGVFEG